MFKLRPYQEESVQIGVNYFETNNIITPCVQVLPGGAGKSICITEVVNRVGGKFLIIQPNETLLLQNRSKFKGNSSIFCAGLKHKEITDVTFATIQSINKSLELFKDFKNVIVDECHLMSVDNGSMFKKLFKTLKITKVLGFTATPYRVVDYRDLDIIRLIDTNKRLNNRLIVENTGKPRNMWKPLLRVPMDWEVNCKQLNFIHKVKKSVFTNIIYYIDAHNLVNSGYLTPLKFYPIDIDCRGLIKVGVDYTEDSIDKVLSMNNVIERLPSMIKGAVDKGNLTNLIFVKSVKTAKALQKNIVNSAFITAETKPSERKTILDDFKSGKLNCIINVGTLTTGTDIPNLVNIFIARPIRSPILYNQICVRGTRLLEGHANYESSKDLKPKANIIDFFGNYKNFGNPLNWYYKKNKLGNLELWDSTFNCKLNNVKL